MKSPSCCYVNLPCCLPQTSLSSPVSSSVHNFNIFMNLLHLEPLLALKRLLFSSENETNIVFHKSLEACSSPLLSDIGSQRSLQGPLIKEQVWPSISLTAAPAEQRHTDYTCHSSFTWNATSMWPADTREQTSYPASQNKSARLPAFSGVASTWGYRSESKRYPKINSWTCQEVLSLRACVCL